MFSFLLSHSFHTSSPIQEKSPEAAFPINVSSASLLHPSQPAAGGMLTSEAEWNLKACTLTDANLTVVGEPSGASAGLQAEWVQPHSFGNVDTSSMNRYLVFIVPLNKDSCLVKAASCKAKSRDSNVIQKEFAYFITFASARGQVHPF